MADQDQPQDSTAAKPEAAPAQNPRPGFFAARGDAANEPDVRDDEAAAIQREKAAFTRAAKKEKDDEEEARLASLQQRAGMAAAAAPQALPISGNHNGLPKGPDFSGKGWIYCGPDSSGRGTWVCDKGGEIKVPFSRTRGMSPGQLLMIRQLSQQKGWGEICAFKSGGYGLNDVAGKILASSGFACCTSQKGAPSLSACKAAYRDACIEKYNHACAAHAEQQMKLQA